MYFRCFGRGSLVVGLLTILFSCLSSGDAQHNSKVVIETILGDIVVEVYADQAPLTSAYFLNLVSSGGYNGGSFYRSTNLGDPDGPKLIQGGLMYQRIIGGQPKSLVADDLKVLQKVETTAATGLRHEMATVSFARDLYNTGVVIPEIFICLGDFPTLDFNGRSKPDNQGFPAFGKVIKGLDLVKLIAGKSTGGSTGIDGLKGQILSNPVAITRVYKLTD